MAKAKKSSAKKPAKKSVAQANIEAEQEVFSEKPSAEVADTNDSFEDLGPKHRHRWIVAVVVVVLVVAAIFVGLGVAYANKIYPGVSVNGVAIGGMTTDDAKSALTKAAAVYDDKQIPVHYGQTTLSIDLAKINLQTDSAAGATLAYQHGRHSWTDRGYEMARAIIGRPTKLASFNYDDAMLAPYTQQIANQTDSAVANAALSFSDTGRVTVAADQPGQRLDMGLLVRALDDQIAAGGTDTITAPVYSLAPSIDSQSLTAAESQASTYLAGPVTLQIQGKNKVVAVSDIISWISVSRSVDSVIKQATSIDAIAIKPAPAPVKLDLDGNAITSYVDGLAKGIDRPGQNAALTIVDDKATVFQPSRSGFTLDQPAAIAAITAALSKPATDRTLALSVKTFEPDVTEASLNSLGINELISEGVTYFPGSPAARMQNIRVGASKFNGVLVKPGDTFSFEQLLGNVDAAAGYAPALVILGDHEEFQYGGGMCQVSSTAYRAALLAGLPIVERHNHSFAVGYYTAPYGVPGVDATVFNLSVDLKFKNDTGHYILIQTVLSGTTLKFDFYGTKTKTGRIRGPVFDDPAGGAGWNATIPSTTTFYRDVLDLAGNVIKTDTITTHYKSSSDFPVVKELN